MSEKNERPNESSSFPYIAVVVLIILIAGLLYAGYESFSDNATDVDELINTPLDTTGKDLQPSLQAVDKNNNVATDTLASDLTGPIDSQTTTTEETKKPSKPENNENVATDEKKPEKERAPDVPKNLGGDEYGHTVQAGETFFGIANRYNMKFSTLKALNPDVSEEDVKSGVTKLNVRVQAIHTVGPGDILRVVAEKYGVSVQALMAANKKTKNRTERGEQLIIPLKEKR